MAFVDYTNELIGYLSKMPPSLAQKCINRAWRDIRDARPWSFLSEFTALTIPAMIQTGTMTVTQYSDTFTPDAAATVALTGLSNPLITLRQIRIAGGPIYSISGFDPLIPSLTLDRIYQEASGVGQLYQVYQCYYFPPSSDFIRWLSLVDPLNAYAFRSRNIHKTRAYLDMRDPQRTVAISGGQLPYFLAYFKNGTVGSDTDVPFFEMWPHPLTTAAYAILALFQKKGTDLSAPTDDIPAEIDSDTLMQRAKYHAYEWAETQKGVNPAFAASNWMQLRRDCLTEYKNSLRKDSLKDAEKFVANIILKSRYAGILGPLDSDWLQQHGSLYG